MTKQRVLLVHSGGFTSRQWRKLADLLASSYEVLAPDLIGYGASGPWPDAEPFHFNQDLALLESLLGHGDPVHIVGHSYGGFLALQLAIRRPDLVRSLALYEPVAFGILDEKDRGALDLVNQKWESESWLRGFVDWWNGDGAWDRLPDQTRAAFRSVGWKVYQEVVTLVADRTDRATYATITAPTLLLSGADSPVTEHRVVETLGAALPKATVKFFPGVGHMGPISHASLVNAEIAAFINDMQYIERNSVMSKANLETYLFFNGNCAEAMKFYEKTLRGQLKMMAEKDAPGAEKDASDKILHARLEFDGGVLMASDWLDTNPYPGMGGFGISRYVESVDEAKRLSDELSKGGKVNLALTQTFWVEAFAMVVDRFGALWMISGGKPQMPS